MAAGDATVEIIDLVESTIEARIEALRVSANDKWMLSNIEGVPGQVILAHIEEA